MTYPHYIKEDKKSQIDPNQPNQFNSDTPIQYLKGVGPKISKIVKRLGINTVGDLQYYYPRAWEDRRAVGSIREAKNDQEITLRGTVKFVNFSETRSGLAIVTALVQDSTGQLFCKWIRRQSFKYDPLRSFRKELQPEIPIIVYGKIVQDFSGKTMMVEEYATLTNFNQKLIHINRIVPIHPTTQGISPKFLRKLVYDALHSNRMIDPLPTKIEKSQNMISLQIALKKIHFPETFEEKEQARKRLAFQELFMLQMVLALARRKRKVLRTARYEIKKNLLTPFKEQCGFEFTRSQKRVIREIFSDLTSDFPMNRLLQGDVGSGKTVVAISAMLLACENQCQSVLMAPTEILAEQHAITIKHFLKSLPVTVGLLTGSVKGKKRKKFLEECAQGKIDIVVGTQALLEKEVQFKKCGLVVMDEQHRFGVRDRLTLTHLSTESSQQEQRRSVPDVLVMTATPIPRTLALGLYGDLNVSTIDELPPGRQKIETIRATEEEAYTIVKNEIRKNHQCYILYPLVDESDKIELKAAIQEFEKLKRETLKEYSIGLLHGQLSGKEKEKTMNDFYNGEFSILVATTVIEVGIDVPNATVMVIQHAERFGLSTLHQLRGRIGRGKDPSYCLLVAQPTTEEAKERINQLLQTQNGFEIAEADLRLRGVGEIFGTSQHGNSSLKIADFLKDASLIVQAKKSACEWLESDPELSKNESVLLKEYLIKGYSKKWHWANIA